MRKRYKHYIIAFLIQIALAGFFIHDWDGFVFITSASQFLQGITPYETALEAPPYTFCAPSDRMPMWYAYPPLPLLLFSSTYAPYFYLLGDNPILGRIFLKLTFILGNLLCAYLVYRFIAGAGSEEKASKAEKIVLYNPFLIFIAAAWGMFDIWMVNFLLLSLLRLRQDKLGKAGIYFGLSVLIKPIPAIFAPLFLVYIWNKKGSIAKPFLFASSAVATFCLVSLPFLLLSLQGFINQVIGMHASRPPFAWAPLQLLYIGQAIEGMRFISLPSLSASAISAISAALLATTIFVLLLYYCLRKEKGERELLASLFFLMLTFTLFNKGVSPQYFVIPLVLAIVLLYTYADYSLIRVRDVERYYKFLVLPYLGAAILLGRHYLLFIPPDIATKLMGKTSAELDTQIATSFPISADFYYAISAVGSTLLLIPAIIMAGFIVYRAFKQIIPAIAKEVSAYLSRMRLTIRRELVEKPITVFMASLFVIMPLLAGVASYQTSGEEKVSYPPPLESRDKLSGCLLYWWNNSSHNPRLRYDSWLEAGLTPVEGFYNSIYAYMKEDIQQMQEAGIDFALISFHDYEVERYIAFAQASAEEGFRFALLIELSDLRSTSTYLATAPEEELRSEEQNLSLTSQTKEKIIDYINMALKLKDSPTFLRYQDKPVLFLTDTHRFAPGWSKKEKKYLAQSLLESYQQEYSCDEKEALEKISKNWGVEADSLEDLMEYYPQNIRGFTHPENKVEQDWAEAFPWAWQAFWKSIKQEVETRQEEVFWIGQDHITSNIPPFGGGVLEDHLHIFDTEFIPSPADVWYSLWLSREDQISPYESPEIFMNYWKSKVSSLYEQSKEYDTPIIISVTPQFNDAILKPENAGFGIPRVIGENYSYDLFWEVALQNEADIILIDSWNQYYESSCIEPTLEIEGLFLEKTEQWTNLLHSHPKEEPYQG